MSPAAGWGGRRWRADAEAVLVVDADGRAWRGRDLAAAQEAWQAQLRALRLPAGSCVGLSLPNGGQWLAALGALLEAGLIVVPREPMAAEAEAEFGAAAGLAAGVTPAGVRRLGRRRRRPSWHAAGVVLAKVTSGTTGKPRIWPFTAAQVEADARQVMAAMAIDRSDHNLAHLPFAHSYALGNLVLPLLLEGVPMTVSAETLPHALADALVRSRATVLPTVPAVIRGLAEAQVPATALVGLRRVISAGSRLQPELARAFFDRFGIPVHNFYGATETGGIAFDPTGEETRNGTAVGWPLPGVTVSRSHSGRLTVASAAVTTIGRKAGPGRGCGAMLLADRGQLRADGAVVLEGRVRGFVKRGGRRISLAEVERRVVALAGVRQAIALALSAATGEQLGLAVETDLPAAELRRLLRSALPAGQRPDRLQVHDRLPTTARGKPDTARIHAELLKPTAASLP